MGKFNMGDDRNRLKEIARKKKEKAAEKEKEKAAASNLKPKDPGLTPSRRSNSSKKLKHPIKVESVDSEEDQKALWIVVAELPKEKGKGRV